MADLKNLVLLSDNLLKLDALTNAGSGGGVITTATVTGRVLHPDGSVIASGITMVHTANGNYEGTVADTDVVANLAGLTVTLEVTADAGAGLKRIFTRRAFVDN